MTSRLRFLASASANLDDIAHYVAEQSGSIDVAIGFVDRITEHCEHLAALPGLLGTKRADLLADIRTTPSNGYVIYFRYTADAIEVINVLHSSRDAEAHFLR